MASPPEGAEIVAVELVRSTATTSLLRVELQAPSEPPRDVALLLEGLGVARRVAPLPSPGAPDPGTTRLALSFALDARALPGSRLSLELDGQAVLLPDPRERTAQEAALALGLRRARERVAELERDAGPGADGALARGRLESQLAELRLLRAQSLREIEVLRAARTGAEEEVETLRERVAAAEQALDEEQAQRNSERAELDAATEAMRARIDYLERRLVEVREQPRG